MEKLAYIVPLAACVYLIISCWLVRAFYATRSFSDLEGKTGNRDLRRRLPWFPIRDLLSVITWCAGLAGRHVMWRGETYRLHGDGRIEGPCPTSPDGRLGRLPVRVE